MPSQTESVSQTWSSARKRSKSSLLSASRGSAFSAKLGPDGVCLTRAHTPIPPRMTSTTVNTSESNPCTRASAGKDSSSPRRNGTTCPEFSHSRKAQRRSDRLRRHRQRERALHRLGHDAVPVSYTHLTLPTI